MQRGLALIAQRPRTTADLRDRLADRFDESAVAFAVARLTELGYVDDAAWAEGYVARSRSAERGARMLRLELHDHGIEAETAAEALLAHDDDAAALAAARRLARGRDAGERAAPDRLLVAALGRRGFSFDTIERALSALAEERSAPALSG